MNIDLYSDRAKQAIQSAQSLALARRHQQLAPEHLLKVLLEEKDGLARSLIQTAGGRPAAADRAAETLLAKLPKVEGGAGPHNMNPQTASDVRQAPRWPTCQGRGRCVRHHRAAADRHRQGRRRRGQGPEGRRRHARGAGERCRLRAQGPHGRLLVGRRGLRRAEALRPRPDPGRARPEARPGHWTRRGDPPHHPGARPPHQEQPGVDRGARGRQDRDRGGSRPSDHRRRCAQSP